MATNNCEIYSAIRRPLDAFIQYFLDVKPYHTKLLEVLEVYNFYDTINVTIDEKVFKVYTLQNKPLCNATGWGVDWDDQCGFDAISCCDLFDCIGGFGLIYNNSDLLLTVPIVTTTTDGTITVSGNYTYDEKLPIKAVLNATQFTVHGNHTAEFSNFSIFLVIPRHEYPVAAVMTTGFTVIGDISSEVVARRNFTVYGSNGNDGVYEVTTASYDPDTNLTTIVVLQKISNVGGTGFIEVASSNKNNGAYQVSSVAFNGLDTVITVNDSKHFSVTNDVTNGSIQFRSGLIYPRHVTLAGSSSANDGDYRIMQSVYNYHTNTTTMTVSGLIQDISSTGTVNLYGYEFEAGFEGGLECSVPKPADIHTIFSERLVINVIPVVTQTPVPSATSTPTPTPSNSAAATVTPTPTPSGIAGGVKETIVQSDLIDGIALIQHDGVHKTQLAYTPFTTLGISGITNMVTDGTTVFAADLNGQNIALLEYNGISGFELLPATINRGVGVSDIKIDTVNKLIYVSISSAFLEAYGYSYDGFGNISVGTDYGEGATPFPWPSQLHDTSGRACYILDNGSIVAISGLDIIVCNFTFTPSVGGSGNFHTVASWGTGVTGDDTANYLFGRRIPSVLKVGGIYLIEIDYIRDATNGDASNSVSRFFMYDPTGHTITDMGDLISTHTIDAEGLSVAGDGSSQTFAQDTANHLVISTFTGTSLTTNQTIASFSSTGDKLYFSNGTGTNKVYVMAPSIKHLFVKSGSTYADVTPLDDVCHTSLSTVRAACFMNTFTPPTPTPTPTPTLTPTPTI